MSETTTENNEKAVSNAGRPSLLTPERTAVLVAKVRSGLCYKTSCELAGISVNAFMKWMAAGGKPDADINNPIKFQLRQAILKAGAEAEEEAVARIKVHAIQDYNADKFLLTHGPSKDNFRPAVAETLNKNLNANVSDIDLSALNDEQLAGLEKLGLIKQVPKDE